MCPLTSEESSVGGCLAEVVCGATCWSVCSCGLGGEEEMFSLSRFCEGGVLWLQYCKQAGRYPWSVLAGVE